MVDETIAVVGNGDQFRYGERRIEHGEVLGLRTGTTTLRAREPQSGVGSTEIDNLTVKLPREEDEEESD